MMLLVTSSLPQIKKIGNPNLGRLFQPRHCNSVDATVEAGVRWACDNDAFQGFKVGPWLRMMGALANKDGCLFAAAPDVVGDWPMTKVLWDIYWPIIHECDLPAAVVLQDGCTAIPSEADAVFIGGSSEWKMSEPARRLVDAAKDRGLWVHMGRVNGSRRMQAASSWGVDSVDGSGYSKWFDTWVEHGLRWAQSGQTGLHEVVDDRTGEVDAAADRVG